MNTDGARFSPFVRDYLRAVLLFSAFLAWAFHVPLTTGRVDSFSSDLPVPQAIANMNEQLYQLQPVLDTTARMLKRGQWPSWTTLPQAGTPLVGKMVGGTFSPLHLPYYLLPVSAMPRLFMLVLALQALVGFSFAYLYARAIDLRFWASFLAAVQFIFGCRMFAEGLYATWPSAIFLPLLLLLCEAFLRGERRTALWLAPWAAALPFLAGHFESAIRCDAVGAVYFLIRLRGDQQAHPEGKLRAAAAFLGACAFGAGLAACQILPGFEYVKHSYNQVWRTLPEFGWSYQTVCKHLSLDDAPLLLLGWAGLGSGLWLLGRSVSEEGPIKSADGLRALLAAAALAAGIACLSWVGLDDGTKSLYLSGDATWLGRGCVLLMLALAFWAATRRTAVPAVRALGFVLAGSLLVLWKTPPFSNILLHLPVFGLLNNTVYAPEFALALAVLGAAGLQGWYDMTGRSFSERFEQALRLAVAVAVIAAGYAAAQPLKNIVARYSSTGVQQERGAGAFMGPESFPTRTRSQVLTGWVASAADLSGVVVGLAQDGRIGVNAEAALGPGGAGRRRFAVELAMPAAGLYQVVAQVRRGTNMQWLNGPRLEVMGSALPLALGFVVAAICLLVCLPWASLPAGLLALLLTAASLPVPTRAAADIPFRLPGLEAIKADSSQFRLSSLRDHLLQADYANIYGLCDIRNGGDNLDVLPLVHFVYFAYALMGRPEPAARDMALRILGLANVRYLLDGPGAKPAAAAVQPIYAGEEMTVFRNAHAMPRAVFFDGYAELPLHRLEDWRERGRNYSAAMELLSRTKLDPGKTLLLHDLPSSAVPQAPGTGNGGRVEVSEYLPDRVRLSVEASRPGVVMLSDNDFPGWQAFLDGRPVKTLRSWFTFRAVEVPAGNSVVEFRYRPWPLRLGVVVSALFAFLWAWLYLGRGPEAPPVAAAPVKEKKGKTKVPPPSPPSAELLGSCALARVWTVSLVGSGLLFWAAWGGFVYGGSRVINAVSCVVVLALAVRAFAAYRRRAARANTLPIA